MTVYFVNFVDGLDANNGLGQDASHASNKPWKTITKALGAAGIASGDTLHLAPVTFRETVAVAMTSATGETFILGDPTNAQGFKTAAGVLLPQGDVLVSAYTTNDATIASTSATLNFAGRDFLTFENIIFVGGSNTNNCIDASTTNGTNITFRNCMVIPGAPANNLIRYDGLADVAANWLFDRCRFEIGGAIAIRLGFPTSAIADYDTNFQFLDCKFYGAWDTIISINTTGAAAFKPGGVDVINCTLHGRGNCINAAGTNISTSIPCTIYNSIAIATTQVALNSGAAGQLVEDYNKIYATTARTNVSVGANSISTNAYPPIFEFGQAEISGRNARPFGMPTSGSPLLGFGSTGSPPSVDILNRPKPAGGASVSNAIGAFERHDTAIQETSTVQAGSSAIKIIGPGDHQFQIPVDAVSTVISIYTRYDTNHGTGTKPQAILLANGTIGIATETKTATVGVDTWEQLTFAAQTPSAKGVVTIRLLSRAAAGNGIAYFDTAAVA